MVAPHEVEAHFDILKQFTEIYCRDHHGSPKGQLCQECRELLLYAKGRLERCPYDPKPACKDCPTHCYKREMRDRVRRIMRYSGIYFVKRGRLDWLVKYFLLEKLPTLRGAHRFRGPTRRRLGRRAPR